MSLARKIGWFVGVAVLVVAAVYLFRHLYRWEWHRALFAGIMLIAAEVAMATALVLRALRRAGRGRADGDGQPDAAVLARLREASPPARQHFAWLQPDEQRLSVFVSVLLGGGVIVSAGAWLIDRVANKTAGSRMEGDLARRLGALRFPDGGLVPDDTELMATDRPSSDDDALRLLLGPAGDRR